MLEEMAFITRHCRGLSYDAFLADEVLQRAVARSPEIIGEASKNVSTASRERHPEVDRQPIAGLRDVLIHKYFGVDWKIVWGVIHARLPPLEDTIRRLVARPDR